MALPNTHSYSAKEQAQMLKGRYDNLRWFQFEGMSGGKIGQAGRIRRFGRDKQEHLLIIHQEWNRSTRGSASYAAAFPRIVLAVVTTRANTSIQDLSLNLAQLLQSSGAIYSRCLEKRMERLLGSYRVL